MRISRIDGPPPYRSAAATERQIGRQSHLAVGRAKYSVRPEPRRKPFVARVDVSDGFPGKHEPCVKVLIGMTADFVPFPNDAVNDLGILLRLPPEHEKSRARLTTLKQVEQLRGQDIGRTVIIS